MMPQPSSARALELPVPETRVLYNRSKMHHAHGGAEGVNKLEAFLMLATLLEGMLGQLARLYLQRDDDYASLRGRRGRRYGLDNAISDLYLLKKINSEEFNSLQRFKDDRNRCMHELFRRESDADIQQYAGELFLKHQPIFDAILGRLSVEMG